MENKDCRFCQFANDPGIKFWENEEFFIFFDLHPVSPGHILIVPKRHVITLGELDGTEWNSLYESIKEGLMLIKSLNLTKKYSEMLASAKTNISKEFLTQALNHPKIDTPPDGYNHGVNEGTAAGQTIDHLHWHIIPRYTGDVPNPIGGVRFVIPNKANYKK